MTIKQQATTVIQVYRMTEQQQATGGGYAWNITWIDTVRVLWIPQESVIDFSHNQERPRHSAKVLTSELAVWNLLTEQNTMIVTQMDGLRYAVKGRQDVGGQGKVFSIRVLEFLISDVVSTMPLSGAVAGGSDKEAL
jgi:hypothetical protein